MSFSRWAIDHRCGDTSYDLQACDLQQPAQGIPVGNLSGGSETPVQRGRTTRLKTRDVSVCKGKAQLSHASWSRQSFENVSPLSMPAFPDAGSCITAQPRPPYLAWSRCRGYAGRYRADVPCRSPTRIPPRVKEETEEQAAWYIGWPAIYGSGIFCMAWPSRSRQPGWI